MADWERIHDILQSAERTIGSTGVVVAHTLQTPDMVDLELLLIDARYEMKALEAKRGE